MNADGKPGCFDSIGDSKSRLTIRHAISNDVAFFLPPLDDTVLASASRAFCLSSTSLRLYPSALLLSLLRPPLALACCLGLITTQRMLGFLRYGHPYRR
ncbi:hypothetical protein EXIGLDRAFT_518623 [Exidia glandulosa HHB12029]|uniref:Uncharacterized protein n=1 Tax=Exidia glandulosa HHB12029 TaxID=1314781 RepID=A0A165J6P2_EXIGL|nr:hypothetical protein EXIGLDRAFT_518623 [Exidia glandulosa HHB12029]